MLNQIQGLHHVTSMAADARTNNRFFTDALALRRVKKTVNFDSPDTYHLYYGDETGAPGSIMTYFPFPHIGQRRPGTGEVGTTVFSVPEGALGFWRNRLGDLKVDGLKADETFGEKRLSFSGPDGDGFALVEVKDDVRPAWTHGGISEDHAIRGFHSVVMRLRDDGSTSELLKFMGYEVQEEKNGLKRLTKPNGNGAHLIDLAPAPHISSALPGAGSVHHVAFAVADRATQLEVRKALMDTGYQVTPIIDRDYFWAIYFRTPGGILFEIATNEPGFNQDEDTAHLGEALKLPRQHEHLRAAIEAHLEPLEA
ncbi:VOC family protein [Phyllobacterium sp. LjRoot231]|uniref:VOC family protein n=1 Tax=Phyllobacterium sp. LjRoot231 TaxID=3342289 RepID=UPI003ECE693B